MATPVRLTPLLDQYDFARKRLTDRMGGPFVNSGNGLDIEVPPMTDAEYLWEPVPGCWSVRPRATAAPGRGATLLVGAGRWGRDTAPVHPTPPPFTTIAWRLSHLAEMLALRADHTNGSHRLTRDDFHAAGDAADAAVMFDTAAEAWRDALLSVADDATLDKIGHSTYPNGSDPEDPFIETVWWVNQELLHHGAEIALLRDLWRDLDGSSLPS
ncbi:hypothetical protein ABIA32_006255 [Streptacidiphilus sp. MAP12-20]|uniref:DinB family protein n=1 Tax=Streptacidiphilus sp. MAP12-20 TaxID=3156299 RepID=UPI003513CC8E